MSKVTEISVKLITVVEAASEGIVKFLRSGKIEEWVKQFSTWTESGRRDFNNFIQLESVSQFIKESCLITKFHPFLLSLLKLLLIMFPSIIGYSIIRLADQ